MGRISDNSLDAGSSGEELLALGDSAHLQEKQRPSHAVERTCMESNGQAMLLKALTCNDQGMLLQSMA